MLVSPQWLSERLRRVVVLDASWHMPDSGRDALAEFREAHIPGAQRFDIDEVADTASPLPHTLPEPQAFGEAVGALGVSNDSEVVIYEAGAPFAAPRAWWMFRVMGHAAHVLDGGLSRWQAEGFPVASGPAPTPAPARFEARLEAAHLADADAVAAELAAGGAVVDVRSPERFAGRAPEPRPGVRAGHMPGARNLHYAMLVTADGRLKSDEALRETMKSAGIDLDRPVITTCGSGVTAAILAMALERLGTPARVYDGSWTEWGGDPSRPVATGEASDPSDGPGRA